MHGVDVHVRLIEHTRTSVYIRESWFSAARIAQCFGWRPQERRNNINWVDVVILVLMLGLGFMGWRNGVIKVAFTLIGGIVGLVLAGRLWSDVAEMLPIDNESVAKIAAFVSILAVLMIAAAIAAKIIKTVLKIVFLGWIDSLAGLAIGLLLGAIAATAVVSAAGIVPSDSVQEEVDESTLAEPLIENMDIVFALLPEEFDDVKNLFSTGKDLLD